MYTAEPDTEDAMQARYLILDPDGDVIATVQNRHEAATLLSHLNRG